ncbi:hypothetical protein NKG99_24165 [Mesorhizobium sp. M1409]|uniref:hypothetical protein n=1 Tax=unclassified Mesorhizobium TaxID=325217 RepID=UPI00333D3AD7
MRPKTGYIISALIGAVLGGIVGYAVYAVGQGAGGAVSFSYWLHYPIRMNGLWWAILGALMGSGVRWLTVNR